MKIFQSIAHVTTGVVGRVVAGWVGRMGVAGLVSGVGGGGGEWITLKDRSHVYITWVDQTWMEWMEVGHYLVPGTDWPRIGPKHASYPTI